MKATNSTGIRRFAFGALRFLLVLLGLLLLLSFGGWIYLSRHKAEMISYIKSESAKSLNADLSIGDIGASLFHTFPTLSISLERVSIRDSLWSVHHHELLNAPKAFASLDLFQLITGHFRIHKIILEDALIYIYTDSTGYTNTSVFRKNKTSAKSSGGEKKFPNLELRNTRVIIEKKDKNKFFSFDIPRLVCRVKEGRKEPELDLDINLHATVKSLAFNLEKGSFIEGKNVRGKFVLHYNPDSKMLRFDRIGLEIDHQDFVATGKFFLAEVPALFTLSLETNNLSFKKAASFVTGNISSKLNQYDISGVLSTVKCDLDGTEPGYKTPLIHLYTSVKRESVHTPLTDVEKLSFTGYFTNEAISGQGHDDENSILRFTALDGVWQNMDFHSDSMVIRNLIQPFVSCNVKSRFPLKGLNNLLDEGTFRFSKGSGTLTLQYRGPLSEKSDISQSLNGSLVMESASFTYLPRYFNLENGRGRIRFAGKDLFIEDLHVHTGNTDLLMNGGMKDLFSFISGPADQLSLDLKVESDRIDLNDFKTFLKKRAGTVVKKKKGPMLSETLAKVTHLLESSSIRLDLRAKQLLYKKFTADAVSTHLLLNDDAINIKDVKLRHAGGSIEAQGSLRNETTSNPFSVKAIVNQVDIRKVLAAFNNFGQQAITDKNIQGILSASVDLKGEVTQKVLLIPDSTRGQVNFDLQQGRLIDFEPLRKISQTVFKNRNFSDIQFADLRNRFIIHGNDITINRMEIRSTVMTLFVEGNYNMKKGADLSIQVPLSNLKNKSEEVPENRGIHSKTGVSAWLRAKTGTDGKLKISWDPFKKSVRKRKKNK